jgi:hypothetical protein
MWSEDRPGNAASELCPACRRIRDGYPAGFVTLSGPFLSAHYDSVLHTIENEAAQETREHPLNRIIARKRDGDTLAITTTDIHLPRRMGEALRRAYKGELDFHYTKEDHILRVKWSR